MVRYVMSVTAEKLGEQVAMMQQVQASYEITDFSDAQVLDNKDQVVEKVRLYLKQGIPCGSVMLGAFDDLSIFSRDEKIRFISFGRMKQCLKIAQKLSIKTVLFYLNIPLYLKNTPDYKRIVDSTCVELEKLFKEFTDIRICFENRAEAGPEIFLEILENLKNCDNKGFCLNYSGAALSCMPPEKWADTLGPYLHCLRIFDSTLQDVAEEQGDALNAKLKKYQPFIEAYCSNGMILLGQQNFFTEGVVEEELVEPQWVEENDPKDEFAAFCEDSPETMLEKIFFYMNQLVGEKGFLSTILLLTEMGRTLASSDRASFWYWDKKKKQYWTIVALGCDRIVVEEGFGIIGASIQNNQVLIVNDPYRDSRFYAQTDKESGYTSRSILCIPVIDSKGSVIGAFQAVNKLTDGGYGIFEEKDVRRLAMAAAYCGRTLEAYLLYQETLRDALTGLKNRRGFWEFYAEDMEGCLQNSCASILICDVDFFKTINDTYGHACGDRVLVALSEVLSQAVDGKGMVARWGGEEFVIVLKEHDKKAAISFAENLRKKIEETTFLSEYPNFTCTVSFGVAEIDSSLTVEKNVEAADKKLYEAKNLGRNQVRA